MKLKISHMVLATFLSCATTLAQADNFKIGLTFEGWQNNDPAKLSQHFVAELNKATKNSGDTFKAVVFKTPEDAAKAIKNHQVDLAYTKIQGYAFKSDKMAGVKLLAVPYTFNPVTHQKQLTYDSYFVTSKDNKTINNWQDLKGKKLLFTHADSLSGYIYPVTTLKDNGVDYRQFFSSFAFTKAHNKTLLELQSKHYDAATIWDSIYYASPLKKNFKVIFQIKDIPNPPVMASTSLSDAQIHKLQTDLAAVKEDALKDFYIAGFSTVIPDNFYQDAIKRVNAAKALSAA